MISSGHPLNADQNKALESGCASRSSRTKFSRERALVDVESVENPIDVKPGALFVLSVWFNHASCSI
jgi:hypothetical protein